MSDTNVSQLEEINTTNDSDLHVLLTIYCQPFDVVFTPVPLNCSSSHQRQLAASDGSDFSIGVSVLIIRSSRSDIR
jgi:hypothetical protein